MRNEHGISGVVATIFLVSIFALTAAIFVALVVNQTPAGPVPEVRMSVTSSGGEILIHHEGGESMDESEIRIIVDGVDETANFTTDGEWPWSIGETLVFNGTSVTPEIQIIYTGGSRTDLLYGTSINATTPAPTSSAAPTANFAAVPTGGTSPLTVQFIDTSSQYPTSWFWNFGDGNTSTLKNPVHTYVSPSSLNYTVTLKASNVHGENSITKTHHIQVKSPIAADFSAAPVAGVAPLTVQFTDSSTGEVVTREWDFGDGNTSANTNPSHTYTMAGTYTVKLTVRHEYSIDTEEKIDYITVVDPVAADFTASPTKGMAPLSVQFTDMSTGNPGTWNWDFGDSSVGSTVQNPTHTYANGGNYSVTLTANHAYDDDTLAKTGYITVFSIIFKDTFDDELGWTQTGSVTWYDGTPKNGSHSVQLRNTGRIIRSIPTTGHSDIMVSFSMGALSLEPSDTVKAEWFDGLTWRDLKTIKKGDPEEDGQLHAFNFPLPPEANNNAQFMMRFSIYGDHTNDYGYVDDVMIIGVPIS